MLRKSLLGSKSNISRTQRRLIQMANQMSNGITDTNLNGDQKTHSFRDLPKTNNFTKKLPADQEYPTPAASHKAERAKLGPRLVKNAAYTYVRPDNTVNPELLGVSKAALKDLAIDPASIETDEFKETVAGNRIITLEGKDEPGDEDIYPWAQCYGGFQFGQWAGQLGDGRAISIFETTNPTTGIRYEIQLKGAGRTPYSRFADGKAVVRSSIREFVVSEALHALGIPTTRALRLGYVLAPSIWLDQEGIEYSFANSRIISQKTSSPGGSLYRENSRQKRRRMRPNQPARYRKRSCKDQKISQRSKRTDTHVCIARLSVAMRRWLHGGRHTLSRMAC